MPTKSSHLRILFDALSKVTEFRVVLGSGCDVFCKESMRVRPDRVLEIRSI